MVKRFIPLALLALALAGPLRAQEIFSGFDVPALPGERELSAVIELRGLAVNQVKTAVIYSTDSLEVARALQPRTRTGREPSADARVKNLGNGKIRATIILPHKDHPTPNTRDANAKVINHPSKVYYAFLRSHTPSGATSELTLNSPIRSFEMPRLLIIAYAGDSYASGEGAPADVFDAVPPIQNNDMWLDEPCHRSSRSGGERAIKKLITGHPELAIRYINVSCSGAEIAHLTANQQKTSLGLASTSILPQLMQIKTWLDQHDRSTVDIFLASMGGNTAGFGPVGTTALLAGQMKFDDLRPFIEQNLVGLPVAYESMDNALSAADFTIGRVVIMGYPDPTRDASGRCGPKQPATETCWGPLERGISLEQMEFISQTFVAGLNRVQAEAATAFGWDRVPISAGNNGMCDCESGFFNTLGQSLFTQGDHTGTMHPNSAGYRAMYRDAVYNQLKASIATWHTALRADARARAIAEAKRRAKAKAEAAAISRRLAAAMRSLDLVKLTPIGSDVKRIARKSTVADSDENDGKTVGRD